MISKPASFCAFQLVARNSLATASRAAALMLAFGGLFQFTASANARKAKIDCGNHFSSFCNKLVDKKSISSVIALFFAMTNERNEFFSFLLSAYSQHVANRQS